jgi:hypothetical protein
MWFNAFHRHLAVARLAAGRTNLVERSLELTGDALLYLGNVKK